MSENNEEPIYDSVPELTKADKPLPKEPDEAETEETTPNKPDQSSVEAASAAQIVKQEQSQPTVPIETYFHHGQSQIEQSTDPSSQDMTNVKVVGTSPAQEPDEPPSYLQINQQYAPTNQQYAPPTHQYVPPNQQYAPPEQKYAPANQQYAPPTQYVPANQQYAPPTYPAQQQYGNQAQTYGQPATVPTSQPRTTITINFSGGSIKVLALVLELLNIIIVFVSFIVMAVGPNTCGNVSIGKWQGAGGLYFIFLVLLLMIIIFIIEAVFVTIGKIKILPRNVLAIVGASLKMITVLCAILLAYYGGKLSPSYIQINCTATGFYSASYLLFVSCLVQIILIGILYVKYEESCFGSAADSNRWFQVAGNDNALSTAR